MSREPLRSDHFTLRCRLGARIASYLIPEPRSNSLIGNGGWYDARYGIIPDLGMNDFDRISGFERPLEACRARADRLAVRLEQDMMRAREQGAHRIIVATHVPPFEELARQADLCAWYGSRASEQVLSRAAPEFEQVLVLCGHTHSAGHCRRRNLVAYSGQGRRSSPALAGLIDEASLEVTLLAG